VGLGVGVGVEVGVGVTVGVMVGVAVGQGVQVTVGVGVGLGVPFFTRIVRDFVVVLLRRSMTLSRYVVFLSGQTFLLLTPGTPTSSR